MAKAFHNSLWIYATFCQHGTMCMSQTVGVEQVVTKFPVNDSGTVFERVRCDQFTIVFYAQWRDLFMSEKEKKIIRDLADKLPTMTERERGYLEGTIATAAAMSKKGEKNVADADTGNRDTD